MNTRPPSGTRDFLPQEVKLREKVFNTIKKVFESFGFMPIETPAFERIETLMEKYGEEGEKLIFKILKRGEQVTGGQADLALRYDFTVPLARFVAEYQNQLPKIFRRYQIGPVWRADRPGKGRFREFYQCDVDTIGSSSLMVDAEIIIVASDTLSSVGLADFNVCLNSVKVLKGLLEIYNIPKDLEKDFIVSLDKLDKLGIDGVEKELQNRKIPRNAIRLLLADFKSSIDVVKNKIKKSEVGKNGLAEVDKVMDLVKPLMKKGKIEFSPFLARGLDYYTGSIFEIYSEKAKGAIAAGGRYDNLIGMFAGRKIPACGISLGVERIVSLLKEKENQEYSKSKVLITVWSENFQAESMQLAQEIRSKKINAEVYLGKESIARQFGFASKNNIQYCVIFGPDEEKNQKVSVKDLSTGEQKSISRSQFVSMVEKFVKRR